MTSIQHTDSEIREALDEAITQSRMLFPAGKTIDLDVAVDAILRDEVQPDPECDGDDLARLVSGVITSDGPWWVTEARLCDASTAEVIGVATQEQVDASLAAGETGIILIDADGDVVEQGSWGARQPGVRSVYVS